ncbi:HAD-like protein [Leucogyrophana mollusca]|uniref:HAD-like protein n=1 Tax=Leucogyrophana mollusca TaxID=85980 RepID=A0ACB8BBD2_9AGAM|nr:HAD-like protein [Leucogyrophana mollusca]
MARKAFLVDAILFDLDGTLIDSTPGVFKAWATFAKDYDLNAEEVAHATHGRRLYDTLKEFCKIQDETILKAEIVRFEQEVIDGGPVVLPGALDLLGKLALEMGHRWTIVTSSSRVYAPAAISKCDIPVPQVGYITSDDVHQGKPHPAPYLAGAAKCGIDPKLKKCLVVEDAPSGLFSGHAAHATTLAVCTSHPRESIQKSGANPDYIVKDLTRVSVQWLADLGMIEVSVDESQE